MPFFRSLLLVAACLVAFEARADSYFYDFAYRFTDGTVVDGRFMGDVDSSNSDRLIHVRQVSAWYTQPGQARTEFNGSGLLRVDFPNWTPTAYLSFSGKWNDFRFRDGAASGVGTTNAFSISSGYQVADFGLYGTNGLISFSHDFFDGHAIDPATGAVPGWVLTLAAVPEPPASGALLAGMAVLCMLMRRRVRRSER